MDAACNFLSQNTFSLEGALVPVTPYKERGERLRKKRLDLQKSGRLPSSLSKLAKEAGVTVSGFQQWERGNTWPRQKKKAKLAGLMGWSEQELDFGPQQVGRRSDMAFHPVSPRELEVLALYRALGTEQIDFVVNLRARIAARQALDQEVMGDLRSVSDAEVRTRMPVTNKGSAKSR